MESIVNDDPQKNAVCIEIPALIRVLKYILHFYV